MVSFFLFVVGLSIGSFANVVVWRLHKGRRFGNERSECDHCHHVLSPADLVPVFSWLWLGGKCRYCHARLSVQHPLVEVATGLLFVGSYLWWPVALDSAAHITGFSFWLLYLCGIVILFLYDLKWKLLPDKIVWPLVGLAVADVLISRVWLGAGGVDALTDAAAGVAVLSGFFALLFFGSGGKWIGFGDVKLGIFMGLVLGMPTALVALLGSYYIAAAVVVVLLVLGKVHRKSQVPFGPFLLAAFYVSFLWGAKVVDWWRGIML